MPFFADMSGNDFILKKNRVFYLCFCLWFLILGTLSVAVPKGESFIWINHWRSFPADIFFSVITWLGTGYFIIPLALFCFAIKRKEVAIGILISFIISGLLVTLLKHYFNYPRPAAYFSNKEIIRQGYWLPLRFKYSFPSGHSTSVFATAAIIALFSSNKRKIAVISFLLACLTAYSRVYLGEHFAEDIWIGSLIGVAVSTIYFVLYSKITRKNKKNDKPHFNKSLMEK